MRLFGKSIVVAFFVLFSLQVFIQKSHADIVKVDTGNVIVVRVPYEKMRAVSFPYAPVQIVSAINKNAISLEKSGNTIFIKPLSTDMEGSLYVVLSNGKIVHLYLQTKGVMPTEKNIETVHIAFPESRAKKVMKAYRRTMGETIDVFLKRIVEGDKLYTVEKPIKPVVIFKDSFKITLLKEISDPMYTAYFGYITNDGGRKARVPVEDIYYRGLLGISPAKLYLNPHETVNIYFIAKR